MNMYTSFVKIYGRLYNYKYIPFLLLTPFRILIRLFANFLLPHYLERAKMHNKGAVHKNLVVSLTSFPARIEKVWMVIEIIKRQTILPEKIILWLSREQFPTIESIPSNLLDRQDDLFEIRVVDGDIKSHKKYYYSSCEFSDSHILLIDDDIFYPLDMIERLLKAYQNNPQAVICQYGYIMNFDENGLLLPYRSWKQLTTNSKDKNLFFGSGGGTLFTPSKLYQDLTNKDLFLSLTPSADDIWLNAMVKLASLPIELINPYLPLPIKGKGNQIALSSVNVGENKNDEQIKAVNDYYKKKISILPFTFKR